MSLRRVYETTMIVNAALEDPDVDAVVSKVTGYIENHGGEVLEVNKWGRRRLAYPINKKYNGFYVHLVFDTVPDTVPILERFLVLEDTVLRHLTLILPEELREFRKNRAFGMEEQEGGDDSDSKDKDKDNTEKSPKGEGRKAPAEEEEVEEESEKE